MPDVASLLIALGCLFLVGLLADLLSHRTPLPRVTLLIVCGFVIGPSALDLLPSGSDGWFPLLADMALAMVGFLLGNELSFASLRGHGRVVLIISATVVGSTAAIVFAGLLLAGAGLTSALLLAGISTATDPAATADVVRESRESGKFSRVLLGIVAIDDAWCIVVFSLLLAVAQMTQGHSPDGVLLQSAREIGGAVVLGLLLGLPMAFLTGRLRPGEPTQAEALGMVLLCGGLALWLEVSFLLASMVLGAVVVNLARHHSRPFKEIEGIEWPFMILFFVLSGAALEIDALRHAGLVGLAYVLLRTLGRVVGAWAGGRLAGSDARTRRWMGLALTPQAGVALALALLASHEHPRVRDVILPVVIASTVAFEIFGPIVTRRALARANDAVP